jgi:predicted alpha/beta hydrolase family esterase
VGEGYREVKQAFVLHGVPDEDEFFEAGNPSPAHSHWLPWLRRMFEDEGYTSPCIDMPVPYNPSYDVWCEVWEKHQPDAESVLVGHSAGGGFLMKWLSEHPQVSVGKIVLVAPWLDPQREYGRFLETELDVGLIERIGELHILISNDEPVEGVPETVELLRVTYPAAVIHRFDGLRHFCVGDTGAEFPALWEICR